MEPLYLVDVFLDKIFINRKVHFVPKKNETSIIATFGNLANFQLCTDEVSDRIQSYDGLEILLSSGKSLLFACKPDALIAALKKSPLELYVSARQTDHPVGKGAFAWTDDFVQMVQSSQAKEESVPPTTVKNNLPLIGSDGCTTGHVSMCLRLSCFGKNIQTEMKLRQSAKKSQYVFKGASVAATFECERFIG